MRKNQDGYMDESAMMWVAGLGILLIIGMAIFFFVSAYKGSAEQVTITPTDKQRITSKDSGYYLVYTSGETYTIKDTITFGRFNSSDLYGHMERGKTYHCTVAGWRMPFFSTYRNITRCDGI